MKAVYYRILIKVSVAHIITRLPHLSKNYLISWLTDHVSFCFSICSNKRAIDFGLGRGYSGNQAAKHFMGLVASQYAGGPGKKRKRIDPGVLMNPNYSTTTMRGRRR